MLQPTTAICVSLVPVGIVGNFLPRLSMCRCVISSHQCFNFIVHWSELCQGFMKKEKTIDVVKILL